MAGNVAIRFSVQNYETVRQALQMLGKDGEKALSQLDAASRKPGAGWLSLSSIMEELKNRASGLAFSLGPVGSGLIALGPVGLAVAATIGGLVAAFNAASERADAFAEKSRKLKDSAESVGLSINQMKQLLNAGFRVGLGEEQVTTFLERLTLNVEDLRRGTGPLFNELLRIDEALLNQIASARDTASAIDVLARAYQGLSTGARNKLTQAIGGKGSADRAQLFDYIAERGGLKALEQGAVAAGGDVKKLTENAARLKTEIDDIKRRTGDIWDKMFSEPVLEQQKRSAQLWLTIMEAAERIAKASTSGRMDAPAVPLGARLPTSAFGPLGLIRAVSNQFGGFDGGDGARDNFSTTVPPARRPVTRGSSGIATGPGVAVDLEKMQRWTSVLGDAITPAEQLRQKVLELAAAQERGGVSDEVRTRALNAFKMAQDRAAVSVRTQLGIVTEEQMLRQRFAELDDYQAKGYIKNAQERAEAERLVRKEVRESYEQQLVRASSTPALTRLSIDAQKLSLNLDEGLAGALRGVTSDMIEMVKGTKTLGQGFTDLTVRIGEAVAQAMLMKSVVGPLSGGVSSGLSSLFGDGGWGAGTSVSFSARGNLFDNGNIVPFARGGIVHRPTFFPMANGMGLMGEAGPEAVMPLRRLGDGRLGVAAAGGGNQTIVQIINNHPNARVSNREEDDGRGGRRTVVMIDEMMAAAVSRPGSKTLAAIRGAGGTVSR